MLNISPTSSYIKIIVIQVDDLESKIVDERHFGMKHINDVKEFKKKYSSPTFICIEVVMN